MTSMWPCSPPSGRERRDRLSREFQKVILRNEQHVWGGLVRGRGGGREPEMGELGASPHPWRALSVPCPTFGPHNTCSRHIHIPRNASGRFSSGSSARPLGKASRRWQLPGGPPAAPTSQPGPPAVSAPISPSEPHSHLWTDGHRAPDIGGKPLLPKTGPKYTIRKEGLKSKQRDMPEIRNSSADLKMSQNKKVNRRLKRYSM